MDKLQMILGLLGALNKIVEAKQDDGKIDAQEVVEILLSLVGGAFGLDTTKLKTAIDAIEDLLGETILSKKLSFLDG